MYIPLTSEDFIKLIGQNRNTFHEKYRKKLLKNKFLYRSASLEENNKIANEILNSIFSKDISISGHHRHKNWEDGWSENLKNFKNSNFNIKYLKPGYYRKSNVQRLNRKFIFTKNGSFEFDFFCILRDWLFECYIEPFDEIFEFGCGPGHNVYKLSEMFPSKIIHGLDWAKSSIKIIKLLASKHNRNVQGHVFNIFDPDDNLNVPQNSAFLSIGGLEQVGNKFKKFLEFIFKKRPKIIIHLEPIHELYDQNHLIDRLGYLYHKKRNYLDGYLTELQKLEKNKKVEIIKCRKLNFGGINHEGWSILIWKLL